MDDRALRPLNGGHQITERRHPNVALWIVVACTVLTGYAGPPPAGTIRGRVTSSLTGKPVGGVQIYDGRSHSTESDARGRYILALEPVKGSKAAPQVVLFFRAEGFRPLTRLVASSNGVFNVALEDAAASEWRVPSCGDARKTRPVCGQGLSMLLPATMGYDIEFTLPCGVPRPQTYSGADSGGEILAYKDGGKEYALSTLEGPVCCGNGPSVDYYVNSRSWSERSWAFYPRQNPYEGLDTRGISKDGTYWRRVDSDSFESTAYEGVSEAAAKYFDAILDTMCVQLTPAPQLKDRH